MASLSYEQRLTPEQRQEHFAFMLKFWTSVSKNTTNWRSVALSQIGYYTTILEGASR